MLCATEGLLRPFSRDLSEAMDRSEIDGAPKFPEVIEGPSRTYHRLAICLENVKVQSLRANPSRLAGVTRASREGCPRGFAGVIQDSGHQTQPNEAVRRHKDLLLSGYDGAP